MTVISRVLLQCVACALLSHELAAQAPQAVSRPLVLFIHGRGQMNRPDTAIVNEWIGALKKGLADAGDSSLLGPSDVAFVMYQHVFETGSSRRRMAGCNGNAPVGSGVADPSIVSDAFRNAKALPLSARSAEDVEIGSLRAFLNRLPERWTQRLALTRARDTDEYLNYEGDEYCSVRNAALEGLDVANGRPLIVVAHSMGTLVAYRLLLGHETDGGVKKSHVIRFISLGSQLGNPIFAKQLSESNQPYPYPAVDSWINILDEFDPLAWPTYQPVGQLFAAGGLGQQVPKSIQVDTKSAWHHQITGYLENPVVIRGIASGWCSAAKPRPSSCELPGFGDVGAGDNPPGAVAWNIVLRSATRFGIPAAIGAITGAGIALHQSPKGRTPTLFGAGLGALLGSALSAAWDRWFPRL